MEGGEMCAPGAPWGTSQENFIKIILESTFVAQHCKAGQRSTIYVLHKWKFEKSHSLWDSSPSRWDGGAECRRGHMTPESWMTRDSGITGQQLITKPRINLWTLVVDQLLIGCSKHIECFFFWTMRLVSRWEIWIISPLNSQMTGMDENNLRFHVSIQCCISSPFYDHSGSGWVLPPHLLKLTRFKFPQFSSSFII